MSGVQSCEWSRAGLLSVIQACPKFFTSFTHWPVQEDNIDFSRDLFQNIFNNYSSGYVFYLVIASISSEKGLISYLIH